MANPQPNDPHGILAHDIQENLLIRGFTEKLLKLIYLIIRLSWGCNCKGWQYKSYKDFEIIGIYKGNVAGHLSYLRENRVIYWDEKYRLLVFNKNYDEWKIPVTKNSGSNKMKTLISESLKNSNEVRNILTVLNIFKNDVSNFSERSKPETTTEKKNCGHSKESIKESINIYTTDFEKFYSKYPRAEEKQRTFKNWKTCLKKFSAEELIQAGTNYKNKVAQAGTNRQFIKTSANFLGREGFFKDYIDYKTPAVNDYADVKR